MPLPPTFNLAQRDTVRLISTGRLKDPVLLPLAANHGAVELRVRRGEEALIGETVERRLVRLAGTLGCEATVVSA